MTNRGGSVKRLSVVVLGAFVASLLVLLPGGNVGAEHPDGLVVNPDEGVPGDLIATQVDPEAVEEACITTAEELIELLAGEGGLIEQWEEYNPFSELEGLALLAALLAASPEDLAAALFQAALETIAANADGEADRFVDALPYLLSFIDIATQEPVGEMSEFDPETGQGTIEVPDLDPGLWIIAAFCVEPQITPESAAAAIAAGAEFITEGEYDLFDFAADPAGLGAELVQVMVTPLMAPRHTWTSPFTVLAEAVVPSPENEVFCAVLPALQPLGAEILEALANLPEDDGEMTQEEWEELADWDAIGAELEELFAEASELLADGDESRPDTVAPQWETVTQGLRDARNALEAVDYDLSTESGRAIAGALREGALDDSPNPEGDAATAVLTQWFIDNCIPEAPPAPPEVPVEETPRAAPAPAAVAQPTFAG
jgi:hypothetical protein